MLKSILEAIDFMGRRARNTYAILILLRSASALLDLVAILSLGLLVSSLISPGSIPAYLQKIVIFIDFSDIHTLRIFAIGVLVAFVTKALISIILLRLTSNFLARQEKLATQQILQNVLNHGVSQMKKASREEIQFAIQVGTGSAYSGLLGNLATLVTEASLFLVIIATFLFINPIATFTLVVYLGAVAITVIFVVGRKQAKNSKFISSGTIEGNKKLSDAFESFREISTSGHKDKFIRDILNMRAQVIDRISNQNLLYGLPRHIIETAVIVGILLSALTTIGNLNVETASLVAVFASGSLRIVAALLPWQAALSQLKLLEPEARVALNLLHERGKADTKKTVARVPKNLKITFENVSFSYGASQKFQIKNLNFTVENNEFLGIIGTSGSGKSTIVDLALGLLDPNAGNIFIGDKLPGEFVRDHAGMVAYVPQRPALIRGTLADNISLGNALKDKDRKRIFTVLETVGLSEKVKNLSGGIDTEIQETTMFSGGELQRLGLARALYSNPRVLVLDEITSGLDPVSEAGIAGLLESLKGKITIIVVAHRRKTVEASDRIIEIANGKIVRQGRPAEIFRIGSEKLLK